MNIIKSRQEERMIKIREIIATLKKAKEQGIEVNKKRLIAECCMRWGMSLRSVKEYVDIAEHAL